MPPLGACRIIVPGCRRTSADTSGAPLSRDSSPTRPVVTWPNALWSELGVEASSIPTHASRRPLWPDGVVGSITHSRRYAIAVVGVRSGLAGMGVDLEMAGRVTEDIAETVMSPNERDWCQGLSLRGASGSCPPTAYTANFSAKEAVFKAVNPIVGLMVGFREVEIRWLAEDRGFTATYVGRNRENAIIDGGRGVVFVLDDHVGALFWIDAVT